MTTLALADPRTVWRHYLIDTASGKTRSRWGKPPGLVYGLGVRVAPFLFASAYVDNGKKVLRIGAKVWELADPELNLRVEHVRGPYYRFEVLRGGTVEWQHRYWSSLAWCFQPYDPDRYGSQGDFFLKLWSMWRDPQWRTNVRHWEEGFPSM